jgi:hypothetical protein
VIKQLIFKLKHLVRYLGFVVLSASCLPCNAFEKEADDFFLGFSSEGIGLAVMPTSMMDDETLFRSAEAEMDFSMSRDQKQVNYYWLASARTKQYSGTAALRKIIRMGILYRWRKNKNSDQGVHLSTEDNYNPAPFFLIDPDNYNLLVSDDKLILGFRYRF